MDKFSRALKLSKLIEEISSIKASILFKAASATEKSKACFSRSPVSSIFKRAISAEFLIPSAALLKAAASASIVALIIFCAAISPVANACFLSSSAWVLWCSSSKDSRECCLSFSIISILVAFWASKAFKALSASSTEVNSLPNPSAILYEAIFSVTSKISSLFSNKFLEEEASLFSAASLSCINFCSNCCIL